MTVRKTLAGGALGLGLAAAALGVGAGTANAAPIAPAHSWYNPGWGHHHRPWGWGGGWNGGGWNGGGWGGGGWGGGYHHWRHWR